MRLKRVLSVKVNYRIVDLSGVLKFRSEVWGWTRIYRAQNRSIRTTWR